MSWHESVTVNLHFIDEYSQSFHLFSKTGEQEKNQLGFEKKKPTPKTDEMYHFGLEPSICVCALGNICCTKLCKPVT